VTPPDLSGCYAKLARARRHIEGLREAAMGREFKVELEYRLNLFGDVEFVVVAIDDPPLDLASIIGDAVHNVRSALDHLVCALARAEGHDCEHPRTAFPILWQPRDWSWWSDVELWNARWRELANNSMKLLRDDDREFFRSVQPYHAFWPTENIGSVYEHPLAMVERLWQIDKHRLLLPGLHALERLDPRTIEVHNAILGATTLRRAPLRVGDIAFTIHWTITGPGPSITLRAFPTRLAFDDGYSVLETLEAAHAAVAEIVVRIELSRP
jgi:hypothetical protein